MSKARNCTISWPKTRKNIPSARKEAVNTPEAKTYQEINNYKIIATYKRLEQYKRGF
jgi:hypothetical protein